MTKDEALDLALEALEYIENNYMSLPKSGSEAITAIKQARSAPVQEPVGLIESLKDAQPCCGQYEICHRACTPRGKFLGHRDAQRQWVGLTDEELYLNCPNWLSQEQCKVWGAQIEAKLKEKNGGVV